MTIEKPAAVLITSLLYGGIIIGLMLMIDLKMWLSRMIAHKRLSDRARAGRPESGLDLHLRQLLRSTLPYKFSPAAFRTATAAIFLTIFCAGVGNIAPAASLSAAASIAAMPYVILRIRLESLRSMGSCEGEALMSNLLSQYRIRRCNIYEAVEAVIKENTELKTTRKMLFRMMVALRTAGSEKAAREALDLFSYAIDTNWSRMLANNIFTAAIKGADVSLALEDILIQLREARALSEERKRLNSESVRMTIVMVPLMYAATVAMSVAYLDMPAGRFLYNQFCTREGFLLFAMMLVLFLINLMLIEIVHNQRFDY